MMRIAVFLVLVVFLVVGSGCRPSEQRPDYTTSSYALRVECVDGHKFVVFSNTYAGGVAQLFTQGAGGRVIPAMCAGGGE